MSEQRQTKLIPGATSVLPYPDLLRKLTLFRDHHGTIVKKALDVEHPNYELVDIHQPLVEMAFEAIDTIEKLTKVNEEMRKRLAG